MLVPLGSELPDARCLAVKNHAMHRILFVGRVYPVKGLVNLVQAFARLKNANRILTPWQVVIAGPDQAGHMEELIALAQKAGLTVANLSHVPDTEKITAIEQAVADIVFTGGVYGEVKDALHPLADLFVLPSFTENFGVVITDALAYGLPVITTQGTPWRELEEKKCGWWIPIGDEPLAEALNAAIMLTEHERHAMGLQGRLLVDTKYTWPAIAQQMHDAYAWLLHGGEKPDCVFVD
jgi:glycosyltransferase involved in cell wall biosynthesis